MNTQSYNGITELFYQTVHIVNAKDDTKEQLDVWATGCVDLEKWDQSFGEHHTVVAIKDNVIAGFGDMNEYGYLDRLYVHKAYQKQGIATAICNGLEQSVRADKITTHASITAKLFFEHRGYKVVREQLVIKGGIPLINFIIRVTPPWMKGKYQAVQSVCGGSFYTVWKIRYTGLSLNKPGNRKLAIGV